MRFRDRFTFGLAAILLLFGVLTVAQAAVSEAGIARIRAKIDAGGALSNAEIIQVEEFNASASNPIDLEAAFERARAHQAGDDADRSHGGSGGLDIWQYTTVTYSWRDTTALSVDAGITGDDALSAPIALGVPFRWFGATMTDVRISIDGYLTFSSGANTGVNTALPSAAEPNNALYVFWDDLIAYADSGDFVKYEVRTDSFLVTWRVHRVGGTAPISFQAILRAGAAANNGKVTYQYKSLDVRNSCTVGMEDATGTYALQMAFNGTPSNIPAAGTSAYVLGEPGGMPAPVTNLAGSTYSTSTCVLLSWTNPTTDTYGSTLTTDSCDIYQGTSYVGRVYGATSTYAVANTQVGTVEYTVYAWNGVSGTGYRSLGTTAAVTVAPPVYDYVEDFEASAGGWTTSVTAPDTSWQWGTPTNVGPATAHSGTKLWGTNISGRYGNNACYQVELDLGQPVTSAGAGIAFWAWYKSESSSATSTADGCNFRASVDGGASWQIVMPLAGAYDDTLMTANNTCIGTRKATWNGSRAVDSTSGITSRWRYFVLPLGQYEGQTPKLRFVFGSDQAANNHPGFYFDDMAIWGIAPGAGYTVSGTVLLDGGAGDVTQALVRASGLGLVNAAPAAGGAYSLLHVQGGNQAVWATLAGYQTATLPLVLSADAANVNLTLRRLAPVAPEITASGIDLAGVVTLDWTDSPDLLVDMYRIYAKLPAEATYTLKQVVYGRTNSTGTDTLTTFGTYQYVVTACDTNVIAPAIESAYSNRVELMMGALAPHSLYGRGDWDDHTRLTWAVPGTQPLVEMSYDNGVNSPLVNGIGFSSLQAYGWFAARYHAAGPVTVHRLRVYFTGAATIGDQFQVGLFADNGSGRPTFIPRSVITTTMEAPLNSFRDFVLTAPDTFQNGTFYVGVRQSTANRIAIGGDMVTPFVTNSFFYASTQFAWGSFDTSSTMILANPMMRAVVQGLNGAQVELSTAPFATGGSAAEQSAWAGAMSSMQLSKEARGALEAAQLPTYLTDEAARTISQITESRLSTATDLAQPFLEAVTDHGSHGGSSLDQIDAYRIYRNGALVGTVGGDTTFFNDPVPETTDPGYSYYVTAHYPNGSESAASNTVTATPRMAPGAPTVANGVGSLADTSMRLTWADPMVNADGSLCGDLTKILIYRSGILIDSVAAGVQQYVDHVQYPNATYTWSLRGADEVRNIGPAMTFAGAVDVPWQPAEIDWVDISVTGTNTGMTGDDATTASVIPLGFSFPFYGTTYTGVKLCINGWLSFLPTTSTNYTNATLPATGEPNATVYAFWDDLLITAPAEWVKYKQEPGRFIASWRVHSSGVFEFQIVLEDNGAITINYLTLPGTTNSYTMGVENATGTSAIQLYHNGGGLWTPTADSAVQFFAPPPIYRAVSGHVALDGGAGVLGEVVVTASGNNHPQRICDAAGNFSFDSVAVGTRSFTATLAGYTPSSTYAAVPLTGLTGVALTLRRQAPPAPENFQAEVATLTQVVTLEWDASSDLLVDFYKLYRRLPGQGTYSLLRTIPDRLTTSAIDTLVAITGGVSYMLSAVDTNVTLPWLESAMSTPSNVVGGHPAARGLVGNTSIGMSQYDNIIHLEWIDPSMDVSLAALYDNGMNSPRVNGIGWWGHTPAAGWIATRFDLGRTARVEGVSASFTQAATAGDPVQVALFADANGVPAASPLAVLDAVITEPLGPFQHFRFTAPVEIPSGAFYVAVRQMTERTLGLGGDETTPFINGTFVHNMDGHGWEANEPALTAIPLLRALVENEPTATKSGQSGALRPLAKAEPFSKIFAPATKGGAPKAAMAQMAAVNKDAEVVMLTSAAEMGAEALRLQELRAQEAETPHSPQVVTMPSTQRPRNGASALDQLGFRVYRDGVLLGFAPYPNTFYNDMNVPERENHTYYVTVYYDDLVESGPSNSLTTYCSMVPGPVTNLLGEASGDQMQLSWDDPIINADASPCGDLAWIYIERYLGSTWQMRDSVAPAPEGERNHYNDTPPVQTQLYKWKVFARDENYGNNSVPDSLIGIVEAPWHEVQYEWIDISQTGTSLNLGNDPDDVNVGPVQLGFSFPFYGANYTALRVCSNGWITFNTTRTDCVWAETTLPTTAVPNNAIYPFWDDLDFVPADSAWIKYQSSPNRFVISYKTRKNSETNGPFFQFQVILDLNGGVRIQYMNLPTLLTTFTLGVENATGTEAILLRYDQVTQIWMPSPESAVQFWGGLSGAVSGNVTAQTGGADIADAAVWATTDTSTSETVHTNISGDYLLRLPPATYTLHFEHPDFCETTRTVVIQNNMATTQNAALQAPVALFNVTSFTLEAMQHHDTSATFTIRNLGGQCPLEFTISDTSGWLSADPDTGVVAVNQTQTVTLHCDVDSFPLHASLQSAVVVTYNAVSSPRVMQVDLSIIPDTTTGAAGDHGEALPTEFALKQNYPNPFNPTTELRFDVPRESLVKLVIFNVMGQEVATVVNSRMAAGRHRVTFDAGSLPTGMYLARMDADGFSAVSKMMLLK